MFIEIMIITSNYNDYARINKKQVFYNNSYIEMKIAIFIF
jgi:hypothetical protein